MEAEIVSRILDKLVSSPNNALYQDELLSCYRDRLISTCSEELRLIRRRAANLGKNDGNESRAALVLQHIMETMLVVENPSTSSSRNSTQSTNDDAKERQHAKPSDLVHSQLVFDRKYVPTTKDLANCIHVKPKTLETLKKSLQFYFTDNSKQIVNTSFSNCLQAETENKASNLTSAKFIQKLLIRLVSMVDFDYNAQQVVASATKLYKEISHFKLYGSLEAQRFRSATEYDMDKFHHYYCASCCLITLLGVFKQHKDNSTSKRNAARYGKTKATAKKTKDGEKDIVKQTQNCILQNEGLSSETFENILKHVQNIILEIQKQKTELVADEKQRKKGGNESGLLAGGSNSDLKFSELFNERNSQMDCQQRDDSQDNQTAAKKPRSTCGSVSELDLHWGRVESSKVNVLCGSEAFQQWKKSTLKNYISDIAIESYSSQGDTKPLTETRPATAGMDVISEEMNQERKLKELAAAKILRHYGLFGRLNS